MFPSIVPTRYVKLFNLKLKTHKFHFLYFTSQILSTQSSPFLLRFGTHKYQVFSHHSRHCWAEKGDCQFLNLTTGLQIRVSHSLAR